VKSLVLGGTGFLGSHLVDSLLVDGDEVRVLAPAMERFRGPAKSVDYRIGSISDPAIVDSALNGIDIVYHLANSMVPSSSNISPSEDIKENLLSTVGFLESMKKTGVRRIIFLSSGGTIYGECGMEAVPEDHPLRPISSYAVVKIAIENYISIFERLYGFSACILRPSNPFGPRQGSIGVQGIISTMLYKAAKGEPLAIWGDGRIVRDFLYVKDLVDAISAAGRVGLEGTFNIGSGLGHSIIELVEVVKDITGVNLRIDYQSSRQCDIQKIVLDISKIYSQIGWCPKVSLEDGIEKQWLWMKSAIQAGML
jgi:UDP-glucose 4-epimerase